MVRNRGYMAGLKGHLKSHQVSTHGRQNSKKYGCKFSKCGYKAVTASGLSHHVKIKHTPGQTKDFRCDLCPARFYSSSALQTHIANHVRKEKFECNQCEFTTHFKKTLCSHRRSKHGKPEGPVLCPFPGCKYSSKNGKRGVRRHQLTHETDPELRRPFACSFPRCSHRYSTRQGLKQHSLSRHNPARKRNFMCGLCDEGFCHRGTLNLHITFVHTKEKVYRCEDISGLCSSSLGSSEGKAPAEPAVAPAVGGITADRVPVVLLQKIFVLQLL